MKGARYKQRGWFGESRRHYLAAKGISTGRAKPKRYYYTPTYATGDLSLIAADGVGTAGAAVVPLIPAVVAIGGIYLGARGIKRKSEGKSFFATKHMVRIEGNNGQVLVEELTGEQLNALDKETRKGAFRNYSVLSTTEDKPPEPSFDDVIQERREEAKRNVQGVANEEQVAQETTVKEESPLKQKISKLLVKDLPSAEEFAYKETLKETKKSPIEYIDLRIERMEEAANAKDTSQRQKELAKGALKALKENRAKKEAKQRNFASKEIPIRVDKPDADRIYPISPAEAKQVLKNQDPEHIKGIKSVEFSNPKGEQKGAWAQYVRSRKTIKVFSQPYNANKIDGRPAKSVNKHMKEYVIPHEIGHHRALAIHKITDKDLRMAEARADAHVYGMSPTDRDVRMLAR